MLKKHDLIYLTSLSDLPLSIQRHLALLAGSCGFAVQNLNTGQQTVYQNRCFVAASTIKLPIMSAFWASVANNSLSLEQPCWFQASDYIEDSPAMEKLSPGPVNWLDVLEWMIVVSDNTATNLIIKTLGIDFVNAWLQQSGFVHTQLNRYMMDLTARSQGIDNWTTPLDMLDWMRRLVNQQLVSIPADQAMLNCLFRQQDLEKIPSGFQEPMRVANKPGELPGTRSDVGYITDGQNQMIISVFCDQLAQDEPTDEWIGTFARLWWVEFTNS